MKIPEETNALFIGRRKTGLKKSTGCRFSPVHQANSNPSKPTQAIDFNSDPTRIIQLITSCTVTLIKTTICKSKHVHKDKPREKSLKKKPLRDNATGKIISTKQTLNTPFSIYNKGAYSKKFMSKNKDNYQKIFFQQIIFYYILRVLHFLGPALASFKK